MRRPPMLWGWEINLNLTKGKHYGKTSDELIERLYEITEVLKTAGIFTYRDPRTNLLRSRRVVVSNIQGAETTGDDAKGRYTISLLQLDEIEDEGDG